MKRVSGAGVKTRNKRRETGRVLSNRRYRNAVRRIDRRRQHRAARAHRVGVAVAAPVVMPSPPPSLPNSPSPNSPPRLPSPRADSSDDEREFSKFSFTRSLPMEDIPINARFSSNFYIIPSEVVRWLDTHAEIFTNQGMNLNDLRVLLGTFDDPRARYQQFWAGDRNDEGFIRNEYRKLHANVTDSRKHDWMFPYLIGRNGSTLSIPSQDVFDLPIYLLLYILRRLTQFPRGRSSFTISYSLSGNADDDNDVVMYPVQNNNGHPITIINGILNFGDLETIYMTIIRRFAGLISGFEGESSWNGSEDSGTRIILYDYSRSHRLNLKLKLIPTASVGRGHCWTQAVEDLIRQSVGDAVISVKNESDNKCLIYCLIIAIIIKLKTNGSRVFGLGTLMVESAEVYCKAMYYFNDDSDSTKLLKRLARLTVPPVYSQGKTEMDDLFRFVDDIDKKAGTMISVSEFREEFAEIERRLIPDKYCGIDVYGLDYNVNSHVYPLYISPVRQNVIELLCVTPYDTKCSHYCVIVNMTKLLRESGNKQFFSCSKCGQCFYHRRLLKEHACRGIVQHQQIPGDGGFHYSRIGLRPDCDIICGACTKCRLCFVEEFTSEYHKEHCFMQGRTGYRHVQLVTYKEGEHPKLKGEEIDLVKEEEHVKRRRVMYADFECSIDSETGVHSFMSYGIYDWKSDHYECGYSIEKFIQFILDYAYNNEEDQIYVYFHNAMGYDANFILRHILKEDKYKSWGIQVIMKSSNRLQKLVLHTHRDNKTRAIHIGDTFLFLTLSLERIVDSIRKDDIKTNMENFERFFKIMRLRYPWVKNEDIDHILRKNIFPYKFFTGSDKLEVEIEEFKKIFEPRAENLSYFGERVTLDDLRAKYDDTMKVIEIFQCLNACDYHDLYLCCDVMQLADVFERSMSILWESHHIHLTKYLGMPSASWAAFLRHDPTMEIPLYEDTFFAEFFKGMIRGGITSAPLRHAEADETHSILYLDVNGLYPYVMQAYKYPCGQFKFIPLGWQGEMIIPRLYEQFRQFEDEGKGMCYCVDIHIPERIKQLTDMYPFAPEHRKIFKEYFKDPTTKELTPFLKRWAAANEGETMSEFNGLVCTLYDKTKYNVHWRLLKFYIEHGVEIKKVYFGVSFDEGDYLAGYIRKNITIRNGRKDELGKTLYKLLGNSIYGKTFESPFKRNTYEIVRDKVKLQGLITEGNIASMTPIDDLGWIVQMDGEDIILDKPTYIGACVCEYSKLHMYTLLYDKLMKIFPEGCELVYTDTDSFIIRVKHDKSLSVSPEALFSYIKEKDETLIGSIGGQIKSETGEDDTIQEVIALRSKVYAYRTKNGHIGKRAKGTTHDAQEMQLDWDTYKLALESLTSISTRNMQFIRRTFKIATVEMLRQSLSVNDGKRDICEDGIHTHAFGF